MHTPSLMAMLVVLVLAFLLFGKPGRLSSTMEDLGKGIKGFRKGLSEGDTPPAPAQPQPPAEPPRMIPDQSAATNNSNQSEKSGA